MPPKAFSASVPQDPSPELLLAVWEALAEPHDLAEGLERLKPRLAAAGFGTLAVYALGSEGLERQAGLGRELPPRLSAAEHQPLHTWCGNTAVVPLLVGGRPEAAAVEAPLTQVAAGRPYVVVRLEAEGSALGLLLALDLGDRGEGFAAVLAGLRAPLSAALARRLHIADLAARRAAAEAESRSLLHRLGRERADDEPLIGASGGLSEVLARVDLVASSDLPVLLFGETGSGKEVVARAVHRRSARASGPFLRVNCGAIPAELIDSQLFGHEKGSFTGAVERRSGWFERAERGTLFLDEVAELPLAAQVRLLRVLQDGSLERVGGQETLHADCRIVAATHRDLPALVQAGTFRQDLWYRLAVFPIVLPPLRERHEDIPSLAHHFARRAARRFGLSECRPSPSDLDLLIAYDWPGNVRELAAVIDRAAILGKGKGLEVELALGSPSPPVAPRATPPEDGKESAVDSAFPTLDAVQRSHIERALGRCRGRIEGPRGAARLLDVNPHTLRARMRRLGIEWRRFRAS